MYRISIWLEHKPFENVFRLLPLSVPGSTSVLFVEKVLVVEGGGDAFASGVLDRLAGAMSRKEKLQKSFSSTGWTVLSANQADNIPDTVEALKNLGIKVAALFDADAKGRVNADKIKDKCPVLTYERSNNGEVDLDLSLLLGLEKVNQDKAISNCFFPNTARIWSSTRKFWMATRNLQMRLTTSVQ